MEWNNHNNGSEIEDGNGDVDTFIYPAEADTERCSFFL